MTVLLLITTATSVDTAHYYFTTTSSLILSTPEFSEDHCHTFYPILNISLPNCRRYVSLSLETWLMPCSMNQQVALLWKGRRRNMGCIGDSLQSKCAQRRECPKNFEYFLHKTSHILCIKFATHTVLSQSFTPYAFFTSWFTEGKLKREVKILRSKTPC